MTKNLVTASCEQVAASPGPWSFHTNKHDTAFIVRDANDRFVCEMSWHSFDDTNFPLRQQSEANACRIAAAPDLLTALDLIATEADSLDWAQIREIARRAIDKARGRG